MKIKINLEKKQIYFLIALIVLIVGISFAIAYVNPATGVGHPAEDIGLGTIADTLTITEDNKVGIGTTSPGGLLGLKNENTYIGVDGSNNLAFTDAVTGTKTLAELTAGGGGFWTQSGSDIYYIDGNVGIGTTSPTPIFGARKVLNLVDTTNNVEVRLQGASGGDLVLGAHDGDGFLLLGNAGNLIFSTDNMQRMRIDNTGNVGIGTWTTSPSSKLDVRGEIWSQSTGANTRIVVGESYSANGYGMMGWNVAGNYLWIEPNGANDLILQSGIEGTGNVGIGTISSSAKLEVAGDLETVYLEDRDGSNFFDGSCTYGVKTISSAGDFACASNPDTDTTCHGGSCNIANTGTLDGYEAADLLAGGGCPPGMVDQGTYCIETVERGYDTWFNAAQACQDDGKRLCTGAEWYTACADGVLSDATDNWEWIDVLLGDGGSKVGSRVCTEVSRDSPYDTSAFRCCK